MKIASISIGILMVLVSCVYAFPFDKTDPVIENALQYFKSIQQPDGGFGDSSSSHYADITPFVLLIIHSINDSLSTWSVNNTTPLDFLINKSLPTINYSTSTTYIAVNIIALKTFNIDVENITVNGVQRNLTKELIDRINLTSGEFNTSSWITDHLWGMLALQKIKYNNTQYANITLEYLLNNTNPDGGWGCYGGSWCPNKSSPDETALGLIVLNAYGYENTTHKQDLIEILKSYIDKDGGINSGWGSNIYSTSWVMMAINTYDGNYTSWYGEHKPITLTVLDTTNKQKISQYKENKKVEISLKNHLYEFIQSMQNPDGSFKELYPYKPAQGTAYSVLALLGSSFMPEINKNINPGKNTDNIVLEYGIDIKDNNIKVNTTINGSTYVLYDIGIEEKILRIKDQCTPIRETITKYINRIYISSKCKEKAKIQIKPTEEIKIKILEEEHTLKIKKYNETHTTIEIRSEPITITLEYDQPTEVDLDKDGEKDIIIIVSKNEEGVFEINIQPIEAKEENTQPQKIETPTEEQQNETTNTTEEKIETQPQQTPPQQTTQQKTEEKINWVLVGFVITVIILIGGAIIYASILR